MQSLRLHCPVCTQLNEVPAASGDWTATCGRCGSVLLRHRRAARLRCLAYSGAALLLYLPANALPILSMDKLGAHSELTIWSGCATLVSEGYLAVALLVFTASIAVPLLKLLVLVHLSLSRPGARGARWRLGLYRLVHTIGPWSMLDVFLVAVLVGLVKLGDLARVSPEPGLAAFAGMVVLTLFASASFDPARLWGEAGWEDAQADPQAAASPTENRP